MTDVQDFIGKTVTVLWEPYGPNTFVIDQITRRTYQPHNGNAPIEFYDVSGIVTDGVTRGYAFGGCHSQSNVGERRTESMSLAEIQAGFARKIAC